MDVLVLMFVIAVVVVIVPDILEAQSRFDELEHVPVEVPD